jgi:CelD/BcsL family acetyltransferase involved in cellulose biosynthesis
MARGDDTDGALRIELTAGLAVTADAQAAWDDLAAASSSTNIFYEQWAATAAAVLPEAGAPMVLMAWIDAPATPARLAGLLILQRRAVLGGRIGVAVQNWDQRTRALGEPLVRAGYEHTFWRAALDFLGRRRRMGKYLRLSALIADSPSTRALHDVLAAEGRRATVTRSFERALLCGGPSSNDYIAANIRKKVLKEQRRLRNRLEEQGGLVFDRLAPDAAIDPWIDELFRLEMSGWKGREGVAAAADAATEHCFRAVLREAHGRGRLDFRRLSVGGRTTALLANIEAGDTAFQLKIAYDEEYAAFSPGVLIEMDYLEYALDTRQLGRVDSCARPNHPMIDRIWADRLPIVSLAVPFDRWSSRLACAAIDTLRKLRDKRAKPVSTDC